MYQVVDFDFSCTNGARAILCRSHTSYYFVILRFRNKRRPANRLKRQIERLKHCAMFHNQIKGVGDDVPGRKS